MSELEATIAHQSELIRLQAEEIERLGSYKRFESMYQEAEREIAALREHAKRLGQGDAERYWENRWRDADAELESVRHILSGQRVKTCAALKERNDLRDEIAALKQAGVDEWREWEAGDTVRYMGSGDECYVRMTIGSDYIIHESPDDFESMVVLDDDGDELSVLVGEFKKVTRLNASRDDAARDLLQRIVTGEIGRHVFDKLATGQATETEDGKTWLEAREWLAAAPSPAPADSAAITEAQQWCDTNEGTPAEFLSYHLLIKRADLLGRKLTWAETIEIIALTTNMPDTEKTQLLALGDHSADDLKMVSVPRELIARVVDCGALSCPQYEELEADLCAQSAPEPAQGEEVEVVAHLVLGGIFHGGSGPELGDIDYQIEVDVAERLQLENVKTSEDVQLELMTVAQHVRIMAAAKPDAELVGVLRRLIAESAAAGNSDTKTLNLIDAKLAEMNK